MDSFRFSIQRRIDYEKMVMRILINRVKSKVGRELQSNNNNSNNFPFLFSHLLHNLLKTKPKNTFSFREE